MTGVGELSNFLDSFLQSGFAMFSLQCPHVDTAAPQLRTAATCIESLVTLPPQPWPGCRTFCGCKVPGLRDDVGRYFIHADSALFVLILLRMFQDGQDGQGGQGGQGP